MRLILTVIGYIGYVWLDRYTICESNRLRIGLAVGVVYQLPILCRAL